MKEEVENNYTERMFMVEMNGKFFHCNTMELSSFYEEDYPKNSYSVTEVLPQ